MEILLICLVAFSVSILTFFSGFGLGTILTPFLAIYFPIDLAIALTGVVHFFNNIFKIILVGKKAHWPTFLKFGIPAILCAFLGAQVLHHIDENQILFSYKMMGNNYDVTTLKFVISLLLIVFALMDLIPKVKNLNFHKKYLPLGGALSGFFGGLSGHQGALRSAFLIKAGLDKSAYIGTAVAVSTLVDFTRISVYSQRFIENGLGDNLTLVICASASAIIGAFIGLKLLKKVTLDFIQTLVAFLLIGISIALGAGWM